MQHPLNLHIPNLYEGDPARISWDVVSNADGYILERNFNEPFEGRTWTNLDTENRTWDRNDLYNLTWDEFEALPALGRTWENIDYEGLTWPQFEAKNLTWRRFELLRSGFDIFRGPGTEEPGYTWTELEHEDLTWPQAEAKNLTWAQIKNLMLHRSTMDKMSIGVKKAIYRVAAYDAGGTESDFLTSNFLPVTPILSREDTIQWPVNNGEHYWLLIQGKDLWDIDRVLLTLKYSKGMLLMEDFIVHTLGAQTKHGIYPAAYLQINYSAPGEIQFKGTRPVPEGENWSGCITLLQFVATGTGTAEIALI